jgi:hypothetical protein
MTFDASKLVVGKKYLTRDGCKVEFVRGWHWSTIGEVQLIWLSCIGDDYGQCYTTDAIGRQSTVTKEPSHMDVVSDQPIREPVKVKARTPYVAIFRDGSTSIGFDTEQRAQQYAKSQCAFGTACIEAEIEVTPV